VPPPVTQPETLGEKIAAHRRLLGLRQEDLAQKLGVDPCTISSWESGEHRPTGKSLEILKNYLRQQIDPCY